MGRTDGRAGSGSGSDSDSEVRQSIFHPPTPGTPIPETDTALPCGVRSENQNENENERRGTYYDMHSVQIETDRGKQKRLAMR